MITKLAFPKDFRWGVATSSHQYEGGNRNNNWFAWEQAGNIKSGDSCGLACDWWNHAENDFDLAHDMGLNALRLSLEWSRIEPRPGEWDDDALDRYRQMLQALRDRGIEPMVTLHHFTHPIWFEEGGAFLAPDAPERFADYAVHVVEYLGDLCDLWCTINEPNIYTIFGYQFGEFPPGHHGDVRATYWSLGNMLRAHAAAYHAIHRVQATARVGWAQHYNIFDPAHPGNPLDRLVSHLQDATFNNAFPDAIASGRIGGPLGLLAGNVSEAKGTCDFIGLNLYGRDIISFDLRQPLTLFGRRDVSQGAILGDKGVTNTYGEMYPQGILRIAQRVAHWNKPIYITENGVADYDDSRRPRLLVDALQATHAVLTQGINIRGYYHWSLVDNFEWIQGWTLRFGLYALDISTQARTQRRSAELYKAIIKANAITEEILAEHGLTK
jgi:beta-glucosidase